MSVELKRQELQAIREQIGWTDVSNPVYAELKQQEAALEAEISELKAAVTRQEIEDKVEGEGIPFAVEGVDFSDLDAETITLLNLVVKADRRRIYNEHAIELEQIENAAEERELRLKRQKDALEQKLSALEVEHKSLSELHHELQGEKKLAVERYSQLQMETEDLQSKLANASAQIEERDAEIKRLQSQIDDYQKAKVFGERQAQSIIDVTDNEKDEINAALEALKKKRYVARENWGTVDKIYLPDGSFEVVKRSDVDQYYEPITPPPLHDGGSESQDSFRIEDTEGNTGDSGVPAAEAPEVTFPTEGDVSGSGNESADGTMVDETPVSRAEFEALKERVARLEQGAEREAA